MSISLSSQLSMLSSINPCPLLWPVYIFPYFNLVSWHLNKFPASFPTDLSQWPTVTGSRSGCPFYKSSHFYEWTLQDFCDPLYLATKDFKGCLLDKRSLLSYKSAQYDTLSNIFWFILEIFSIWTWVRFPQGLFGGHYDKVKLRDMSKSEGDSPLSDSDVFISCIISCHQNHKDSSMELLHFVIQAL